MLSDYEIKKQIRQQESLGSWNSATSSEFKGIMYDAYQLWKIHDFKRDTDGESEITHYILDRETKIHLIGRTRFGFCSRSYDTWEAQEQPMSNDDES